MIELVLIDFDDTLALTEAACFDLENDIADTMGYPPMSRKVHQDTWGQTMMDAIPKRFVGIDVEKYLTLHKKLLPDYVERGILDAITPQNIQALRDLKAQGRSLAILTSRSNHEVTHLIQESHILVKLLDGFYYADTLGVTKPNPAVFTKPLNDFGVLASQAIYIGDSVTDAECAKGAGIQFIAVTESGLRDQTDFSHITVNAFASQFAEVVTLIPTLES